MTLLLPKHIKVRRKRSMLKKAQRDMSKLMPKVITDKNGHRKTVYVTLGLPVKPAGGGKVENMDSTDKAKTLKLADFGTPEEVREMAQPIEQARTRDEARLILTKLIGKTLKSRASVEATISKNSIEKILSGKAADKSYNASAHFLAAANLEKLFSNAIEPFKFPPNPEKHNENYKAVKRLYSPMAFDGRIIPVKFTVMMMMNKKEGKRIYSVEAIDVDLGKK